MSFDPKLDYITATEKVVDDLLRVLSKIHNKRIFFKPAKSDIPRLLNLKTWAERNHLSFETVIRVLIHAWKDKFPSRRGNGGPLGVSIRTLTGVKSKEILEDWTQRSFPNKENIAAWKNKEQLKWNLQDNLKDYGDPTTFAKDYLETLKQRRKVSNGILKKMRRRPFRNNPFI